MGCGSSSNKANVSPSADLAVYSSHPTPQRPKAKASATKAKESIEAPPSAPRPPPLTFEVPIERRKSGGSSNGSSNNAENLIRQHPPKRLLRLEEQQVPLTHQLLDDRLAEADLRRQKVNSTSAEARRYQLIGRLSVKKSHKEEMIYGAIDRNGEA